MILPVANKTAFRYRFAHLLTALLAVSLLQIKQTLQPLAQNRILFQNENFAMYQSPCLTLFYRLQLPSAIIKES